MNSPATIIVYHRLSCIVLLMVTCLIFVNQLANEVIIIDNMFIYYMQRSQCLIHVTIKFNYQLLKE